MSRCAWGETAGPEQEQRHGVTSEQTVDIADSYPFVFPADQGREADDEAQDPHGCDQQPCSPGRHDLDSKRKARLLIAKRFSGTGGLELDGSYEN